MAHQTCPKLLRGMQTLSGKTIPTGAFVSLEPEWKLFILLLQLNQAPGKYKK